MNTNQFRQFSLAPEILQVLDKLGFLQPTDIQQKALPVLLNKGQPVDFHGKARTGTGKTLAFGLPLINAIDASKNSIQAVVVAPTRELVVQIGDSLKTFAGACGVRVVPIYGGASMSLQLQQLSRGAHIIVGTPGRLLDHISRKSIDMRQAKIVVLDEADIMLDMGFKEDVDMILAAAPKDRSIWLFSATVKSGISSLMHSHMKNVVSVDADSKQKQDVTSLIKQYCVMVPMQSRFAALQRLLDAEVDLYCIIFCSTKLETAQIGEQLSAAGYPVQALHGDMDQKQRNRVIERFRKKDFTVLVATDVAARGIDVPGITHVFNYGVPDDIENYVHRIGRTGRAGSHGVAITIVGPQRRRYIERLKNQFGMQIEAIQVPSIDQVVDIKTAKAKQWLMSIAHRELKSTKYLTVLQHAIKECDNTTLANAMVSLLYDRFFGHLLQNGEYDFSMPSRNNKRFDDEDDHYKRGSRRRSRDSFRHGGHSENFNRRSNGRRKR